MCDTFLYEQPDQHDSDVEEYDEYLDNETEYEFDSDPTTPKLGGNLYSYARSLQMALQQEIANHQMNLMRMDDTCPEVSVSYGGDDSPLIYQQESFSLEEVVELENRLECMEYQNREMERYLGAHQNREMERYLGAPWTN